MRTNLVDLFVALQCHVSEHVGLDTSQEDVVLHLVHLLLLLQGTGNFILRTFVYTAAKHGRQLDEKNMGITEKFGDFGGSKVGTDSDEEGGMVRACEKKR